ncbi:MAG: hypothetical protein Q8941_05530 [Bacteroidota bacterium]|nr:hypothetical protein [Bacteroidota bacterium]
MKTLLLVIAFALFAYAASAQKDSARITKPVTINKNVSSKIAGPASPQVNSVGTTMNQIDLKLKELEALIDKLKSQKDALSDMSQDDQLRLQQFMDRRSKMETTLSNIMKKFSETASSITQNIK